VAIVGGGNSAFTAARDLLEFAGEIYIINIAENFSADVLLVDEVKRSTKVKFYPLCVVSEFRGSERLKSILVSSVNKVRSFELFVDGVFLEIGLTPNTAPVRKLLKLNSLGEIPVEKDNSTEISGFFAAGDVTDVTEKQIIVAAGEGAKAAIAVYNFLADNHIINKVTEEY
jgi:alkyl hydroperoxide reductase subunit F